MSKKKRRGWGEGSIEQLPDGRWKARASAGVGADGKRRRKVVYGRSKAEVLDKLHQAQAVSGRVGSPSKLALAEWLDRWLAEKRGQVEPESYNWYERRVRLYLKPILGGVRLCQLEPADVVNLHATMTERGVSESEQHKAATTLRAALEQATQRGLVPANAARKVKKPRVTRREQRPLTQSELPVFLATAKADRLHALYVVAIDSGARPGELYALGWDDVDLDARTIRIVKTLEEIAGEHRLKPTKTAKSKRTVLLSKATATILHAHRRRMAAEGNLDGCPVFCDTNGGWLRRSNLLRTSFKPILKRAKLPPIRPYDLRHTSATLLLLHGANVKMVSERLGHESIEITLKHYAHVLPTMQEKAAEIWDSLMNGHQKGTRRTGR